MVKEEKFLLNLTLGTFLQFIGILCITLFIWFSSVGATYNVGTYSITDENKLLELENLTAVYFLSAQVAKIGTIIFLVFLFGLYITEEKKEKKYEEFIELFKKITLGFLTTMFIVSFFMRHLGTTAIEKWNVTINIKEMFFGYVEWVSISIYVAYIAIFYLIHYLYNKK